MQADAHQTKNLTKEKKVQIVIAALCTLLVLVGVPVYAWFRSQRDLARFERIDSPNVLFITAAHAEDSIYLEIGGIDVKARWKTAEGEDAGQMLYRDYIFAVAGEYVPSFTLQMAHTTNNGYTYSIYEANVSTTAPASTKVEGKDYVVYTPKNQFQEDLPTALQTTENNVLYYTAGTELTDAYLNRSGQTADSTYHQATYEYDHVQSNAEPLYWQKKGLAGGDAGTKAAFYHEYILRVAWAADASTDYKDTDIICITAKAE